MPLKVCHIVSALEPGGKQKQALLLATGLERRNYEQQVVVLGRTGPLEQPLLQAGVPVHRLGRSTRSDPLAMPRLVRLLRRLKPDVVHCWVGAEHAYAQLAAAWARVPIRLVSKRSCDGRDSDGCGWLDRWLLGSAHGVLTDSHALANHYRRRQLADQNLRILPTAVAAARDPLPRDELFRQLRLPPRQYVVGAVGCLDDQRGYPDLIWAAELLRVALRDVWLVIIGDGPRRQQFQRLRDQYGAQDAVRFVGFRQDADHLLTAVDLLWHGGSRLGFSLPILEAMSAGVPAVASDSLANRELLVHGQTGYLYPPGDVGELTRTSNLLLLDRPRRQQLGRAAQERAAQHFSVEALLRDYEDLLQSLNSRMAR